MGRRSSSKWWRNVTPEDANAVPENAAQPRPALVTPIADPSLAAPSADPSVVTPIADVSLDELAQQTMAGLNASAIAIAIDVDGVMTCRARAGSTAPEIGTPVQRDHGVTGECVRTAAVVRCDDALHDQRVNAAVCEQLQIGSILVAPLLRNRQAVGVVEAFSILPNSFDDVDVQFLQRVAQQIVSRVWGEEAPPETATINEPADPAVSEEEFALPAALLDEEPPLTEAPAKEQKDTALPEQPFDRTGEFDSAPARKSHVFAIFLAVAALIVVIIVVVVLARSHKGTTAPATTTPPKQSARPAAQDPMAELRRAAEAGDTTAQYQLARAYENGSGIKADPQLANAWLRTAAEHGNPDAQLDWARAHEASDPVEAYTWYVIAGQNGKTESDDAIRQLTPKLTTAQIAHVRLEIGRQYLAGRALPRDPVAAYVWFRLSEWGGDTNARAEMRRVQSQLTAKQVRQAETRATEWIRRHTPPATPNQNAAAEVHP